MKQAASGKMSSVNRYAWIDALRLAAGLSMVGLHATADPNGQPWSDYAQAERIAPIVLRAFLYVARTELFIIISVFLLVMALDRRPRSNGAVLAEQSRRLLVPFGFWNLFFAGYGLVKATAFGYEAAALAQLSNPVEWVGFALLGDVKYHMHFIPTLFGVLLFFSLYRLAVDHPWLGFGVVVGLLAKQALDGFLFSTFWGTDALPYLVRGAKILTYVGYGLFAGAAYGLLKRTPQAQLIKWLPLVLFSGVLLALFKAIGAYKTIESGAYPFTYTPGYWADFLMPPLLFLGCLLLAHRTWPAILTPLAAYSFGIYLCHPIFLDLAEIALRDTSLTPMMQVSIKIAMVLPLTALFVYSLSKLRPLAWTIGLGPIPVPIFSTFHRKERSKDAI